ncbi:uncharacterized protein LOC106161418 isoform X1 [Lingula anatina]|uniref:Uncharacterized protein LOC106161418 isoform X1 n=2 Tax=Lingula anatina TaxID=7574 RepID=A0A1S3I7J1_LINAN|nr:uncharacterized protein LOC106161418 isoform X1 [Lingula anatina]|eukprot:XP_013393821.1 uncharacterized protein LOC106161418 isoform X1 [Lingula anatina]
MAKVQMEYNFLGRSGVRVSNICLGTMTFGKINVMGGRPGNLDEEAAHVMMDRFAELGGNFLDTADAYQFGESEKIVGSWLQKQDREKFVLATKVGVPMSFDDPNSLGTSRKHVMHGVEQSLKRLQTDYIDLYQTHVWDNGTPVEETLRSLSDLVRAGKVRYIGVSNVAGWQLQKITDLVKYMGLEKVVSLQQQYNLLCRETEYEVLDVCINEGIGFLPWSPLKGGWLSGKFKRGMGAGGASSSRIGWVSEKAGERILQSAPSWDQYDNDKTWTLLEAMERIGKEHGKSVAQVAIRWLLQRPTVSAVIIGATKMSQMEDNIGAAAGWELTDDQMQELNKLSMPVIPYPYEMIRRANKMRKESEF